MPRPKVGAAYGAQGAAAATDDAKRLLAECHDAPGESSFHEMRDGWRLHAESWLPAAPVAVLLHLPERAQSTWTLGVRRLAKRCLARSIALDAFEPHNHGQSSYVCVLVFPAARQVRASRLLSCPPAPKPLTTECAE